MDPIAYDAYLQDADGNERTLEITSPDEEDGSICIHLDENTWIRIVPKQTS